MFASALLLAALAADPDAPVRGEVSFTPTEAEASVPERFRLTEASFPFEMEPLRRTERYAVWAVRFPSPIETPDPENNTVHAEYFQPTGPDAGPGPGPRPGVVVL